MHIVEFSLWLGLWIAFIEGEFEAIWSYEDTENGQAICTLEVCGKIIMPTFEQPENTLIKLQLQTGSYNAKHSQLEGSCVYFAYIHDDQGSS